MVHVDKVFGGTAVNDVADTQALGPDPVMIPHRRRRRLESEFGELWKTCCGASTYSCSGIGSVTENYTYSDREPFLRTLWIRLLSIKVDGRCRRAALRSFIQAPFLSFCLHPLRIVHEGAYVDCAEPSLACRLNTVKRPF